FFFFQAEDGIRDLYVTGVQTCALPISERSGLPAYAPGAGFRDAYTWTAIMWPLGKHWALGAAFYYQRLLDGAANSPIVRERGDPNQWTVGIGGGRFW